MTINIPPGEGTSALFRAGLFIPWRLRQILRKSRYFGDSWRRGRDSNPRSACTDSAFRVRRDRPLCHLSVDALTRGLAGPIQKRAAKRKRRLAQNGHSRPCSGSSAGWNGRAALDVTSGRAEGQARRLKGACVAKTRPFRLTFPSSSGLSAASAKRGEEPRLFVLWRTSFEDTGNDPGRG